MDDARSVPGETALPVLERLLATRFSCRAFRPGPVPRQTITRAFAAAQRTPSWCNTQPWQVAVASGQALDSLRARLYALARDGTPGRPDFEFPARYEGVYRDRRKVCGVQLYQALGIGRDERDRAHAQSLENFRCFGAPHAAFLTTPRDLGVYGALDCGLYLMSLMLALEAQGVASIPQAALASYPDVVREALGFAPDRLVVCGLPFGIADPGAAINGYRTEREPASAAVQWFD